MWLATSDAAEVVGTGGYFGTESSFKPGPCIALESSEASRDPAVAAQLWDTCAVGTSNSSPPRYHRILNLRVLS